MQPVILFRKDRDTESELQVAKDLHPDGVVEYRTRIPRGSLVIPRYSCLPFFRELETDVENLGGSLINNYYQHRYVASFLYYEDITEYTPKSWYQSVRAMREHKGPFVLKGETNSLKQQWSEAMYAETAEEAVQTQIRLQNDSLIQNQKIIWREYVPLRKFDTQLNLQPVTNEWRCFFYRNQLLSYGYYWSSYPEYSESGRDTFLAGGMDLAKVVASKISDHVNFFVVDVAEKEVGGWTCIEVNDGCMSGLSMNNPETLYTNLLQALR